MKSILSILLLALCSGCATTYTGQKRVEIPFDIVIADKAHIQAEYLRNGGIKGKTVNGFCNMKTRTLYVKRESMNSNLPDMRVLGHELWHLKELGGYWHE